METHGCSSLFHKRKIFMWNNDEKPCVSIDSKTTFSIDNTIAISEDFIGSPFYNTFPYPTDPMEWFEACSEAVSVNHRAFSLFSAWE